MQREKKQKPVWLKTSQEETEAFILEMANKGISAEKIGLILRDQYGIPTAKLYGKKISKIIEEKLKNKPTTNLNNINKRIEKIANHVSKNPKDKRAKLYSAIFKEKANRLIKHSKK